VSGMYVCRILPYFGHIMRREDNLEKLVVVGEVEGKRIQGSSPTRWSEQVKKGSSLSFLQAVRATMDRDRWRNIIMKVKTSDHDPQ
jgi:hypothetical protein